MSKISFKGRLANGDEDRIKLSTIKGKVGYKITKFQVIGSSPAGITIEAVVKIYKKSKINFFLNKFILLIMYINNLVFQSEFSYG